MKEDTHNAFAAAFSVGGIKPISPDDLAKTEKTLQTVFPLRFYEFATRIGAIQTPTILDLVTGGDSEEAPPDASFDVFSFFGAEEIIEATESYYEAGMDPSFVAIASDTMGNVFGFSRQNDDERLLDVPLLVFDHDFCEIEVESESFDSWLNSFLRMKKETEQVAASDR